jgi:hypothetical protein
MFQFGDSTAEKMPQKGSKVDDDNQGGQGQNNVREENILDVSEIREEEEISEDEESGLRIGDIYIPPPPNPVSSNETTGPRLIITHIENENFKSYAGKQVLGPFHKVLEVLLTSSCIVFINLRISICHPDNVISFLTTNLNI